MISHLTLIVSLVIVGLVASQTTSDPTAAPTFDIAAHRINATLSAENCGVTFSEVISLTNIQTSTFGFTRKVPIMWTRNNVAPQITFKTIQATNDAIVTVFMQGSNMVIDGKYSKVSLPTNIDITLVYSSPSFIVTNSKYNSITYGVDDEREVGLYNVTFFLPSQWNLNRKQIEAQPDRELNDFMTGQFVSFSSTDEDDGLVPTISFPAQFLSCETNTRVSPGGSGSASRAAGALAAAIAVPIAVVACLLVFCVIPIIIGVCVYCHRRGSRKQDAAPLVTVIADTRRPNEYEVGKAPSAPVQMSMPQNYYLAPEQPSNAYIHQTPPSMYNSPSRHELVDPNNNVTFYPSTRQYSNTNPYL
jgi:hypothetical protein